MPKDEFHVFGESDVQHLVSLVQHRNSHVLQVKRSPAHVIHNATRRSNDNIDAALKSRKLAIYRLPTVYGANADPTIFSDPLDFSRHLHRKFTCRHKDNRLYIPGVRVNSFTYRDAKRGGLAGPGYGLPHEVTSLKTSGYSFKLN
jgi:hypothetical protein